MKIGRRNKKEKLTLDDNLNETLFDGYIEELDKKFSDRAAESYDEEFKLGGKGKVYMALITLAAIIVVMVVMFIVMPSVKEEEKKATVVKKVKIDDIKVPATPNPYEGMVKSRFTGTYIKPQFADNRPYAIMFNNIKAASPQSGTSEADIMYEAVVEGGITRMMGIFTFLPSAKIGSIRSARPYYVSIAKEYDALYIHAGGSDDAKSKIKTLAVADLDGNGRFGNTILYRDSSARAPHNAFTDAGRISAAIKQAGYRDDYQGKEGNHFNFYDNFTPVNNGDMCTRVSIYFSTYTQPYFIYNAEQKQYLRYQFGQKHIDKNTGEQLAYTNVIIQYVSQWTIDSAGRQAMDIYNTSGKGVYISAGRSTDITWSRNEARGTMHYKDVTGHVLYVNPGKTYIALVPRENSSKTEYR